MVTLQPYDLPDAALMPGNHTHPGVMAWIPKAARVVLGSSSDMDKALNVETILEDRISVTRRPSGGESMFLSPQMAAISLCVSLETGLNPKTIFQETGRRLLLALKDLGIEAQIRGTSDVCLGERKILGSSIYMAKGHLFYHAVLNVGEDPQKIERYLNHPVREPDYRKGRPHGDFVTSLKASGYGVETEQVREKLERRFEEMIEVKMNRQDAKAQR